LAPDDEPSTVACPCCGTTMAEEERGTKVFLRCPGCGLEDVRIKN
jgi:Zn finger protein HypA/HybF involved in hydrogenase expression